ncbi:MAG: hypothetical protein QXO72_04515, partial [Sulfolobales archaeon]
NDIPWLITPRVGINTDNLIEKLEKAIEIIDNTGIKMWGFGASKNTLMIPRNKLIQELKEAAVKTPRVARLRGVCTSKEQLKNFLKSLKEADLGFSVTISWTIKDALETCKELNIKPHSINISLGVWGKKELLPNEKVLEITTMCGHGMISPRFVNYLINEVKEGRMKSSCSEFTSSSMSLRNIQCRKGRKDT